MENETINQIRDNALFYSEQSSQKEFFTSVLIYSEILELNELIPEKLLNQFKKNLLKIKKLNKGLVFEIEHPDLCVRGPVCKNFLDKALRSHLELLEEIYNGISR